MKVRTVELPNKCDLWWQRFMAKISPKWAIGGLCLFCVLGIAIQGWLCRYCIGPDGVSYLDLARQASRGELGSLVHPYWSPLYPALLALGLKVSSPSLRTEILVVHGVNFLIALAALASFTFLLFQLSAPSVAGEPVRAMCDSRLRLVFAYLLFLWGTLDLIGVGTVTPDLCVAALVYLIAALCCRMANRRSGWGSVLALGVVLALGYYSKAPMLLLGLALIVILALPLPGRRPRRMQLVAAALVFFALTAPFIASLSRQQHHLTFSESGRLNYAWNVSRNVPMFGGLMEYTKETGFPKHPLHALRTQPTVLVFKDTVPGTFPLWYNPVFFYDGMRSDIDIPRMLRHFAGDMIRNMAHAQGVTVIPLWTGIIVLGALTRRRSSGFGCATAWLMVWSLAAIGLFALVAIEARYVAPFVVLFWLAFYDEVFHSLERQDQVLPRAIFCAILLGIGLSLSLSLGTKAAADGEASRSGYAEIVVAEELSRLGLHPGDEIAAIGNPYESYFAHLAQLRVIATIGFRDPLTYDTAQFWKLNDSSYHELTGELWRTNVRAIVSSENCDLAAMRNWRALGNTHYCVLLATDSSHP